MTARRSRKIAPRKRDRSLLFWVNAAGLLVVVAITTISAVSVLFRHDLRVYTDLPGIDLAGLSSAEKEAIIEASRQQPCPCPCGMTLAQCRHEDSTCEHSIEAIQLLIRNAGPAATRPAVPPDAR